MAFISNDDTSDDQSMFVVQPSFMTSANDEDPYSSQGIISVVYPDTKRNLLDAINEVVDDTILPQLPPPLPKESLAVFLRVKPKTEKELEIVKENKKAGPDDTVEIVSVESDYLVAMHAPKESQTFKNSINGMGQLCHRYTFSQIFKQDTGQKQIFAQVVQPKVKDFLGGQNQLIFTYGATSAGKTFTIQVTSFQRNQPLSSKIPAAAVEMPGNSLPIVGIEFGFEVESNAGSGREWLGEVSANNLSLAVRKSPSSKESKLMGVEQTCQPAPASQTCQLEQTCQPTRNRK